LDGVHPDALSARARALIGVDRGCWPPG
jgi:hypothetical protein